MIDTHFNVYLFLSGMVYVDPKNLGYEPYWERWLRTRTHPPEQEFLQKLFEQYVPQTIDYIILGQCDKEQGVPLRTVIPQTGLNMVTQLCHIIDAIYPAPVEETRKPDEEADEGLLECIFMVGVYNSLGATLVGDDRLAFDMFIKKQCAMIPAEDSITEPADLRHMPITMPTIYDYFLDLKGGKWMAWEWLVPEYKHDRGRRFAEILVPTVDTIRTTYLLQLMNEIRRPIVLVGETGTSKTAIIQDFLRQLDQDVYILLNINFSSRTSSMDVQRNLESSVEKRTKDIYGPPMGKKLLCFIDDLNMPRVDEYGTQQPIALLKLLFEKGGFYDRGKDLNWKNLKDICYFAAMGVAGGGRNEIDPRFMSMFAVFNLVFPAYSTLQHIYSCILSGHFEVFDEEVQIAPLLITMTLELYKIIIVELPPTPSKFHYIFNMRDLSRITGGLCNTDPKLYTEKQHIVRVWRNEFMRVICDRLISMEDHQLMHAHILNEVTKQFPPEPEAPPQLETEGEVVQEKEEKIDIVDYVMRDPILFGDYRNAVGKFLCRSAVFETEEVRME